MFKKGTGNKFFFQKEASGFTRSECVWVNMNLNLGFHLKLTESQISQAYTSETSQIWYDREPSEGRLRL